MTMAAPEPPAVKWVISGFVQAVGFRWFVYRVASRLGATGWVRNLGDGRVEVVARGSVDILQALDEELRRGPPASHVENVEKNEVTSDVDNFKSFEIR